MAQIYLIPTGKALDSLCEIELKTGLTIGANGELVKRPSVLFEMMCDMSRELAKVNRSPFWRSTHE